MDAADGGLFIGSQNTQSTDFLDGDIYAISLDVPSDATKGFNCPISETSGTTSYDVSGNGKHITWSNSPTWGTQNRYFWNQAKGCHACQFSKMELN